MMQCPRKSLGHSFLLLYNQGKQSIDSGKVNYIKYSESGQDQKIKWSYFPVVTNTLAFIIA
jgi:hypothetical protein